LPVYICSDCLEDWFIEVLPKSPIGQAVGYARGQWIALNRYIDNGDLAIDNNLAERVLVFLRYILRTKGGFIPIIVEETGVFRALDQYQ